MKKNIIIIFILFFFLFNSNFYYSKEEIKTSIDEIITSKENLFMKGEKPSLLSNRVILVNKNTKQVLYSLNANEEVPVYSVSKLLSVYVILDQLKINNNKYNLETKIKSNKKISQLSEEQNFSNLKLYEDAEYTIKELLDAILIKSSNSATMLLGEFFFENEKNFVEKIREKAKKLNFKKTNIVSSTGLNQTDLKKYGYNLSYNGDNSMTPSEVAYLSIKILEDYPEILQITSKKTETLGKHCKEKIEYKNSNPLLPEMSNGNPFVTGLKTGGDTIDNTSCISFTANKDNIEIVGVILSAKNSSVRSTDAHKLIDYAFNKIKIKKIFDKNDNLFENNKVLMKYSLKNKIGIEIKNDFLISYNSEHLKPCLYFLPTNDKYDIKSQKFCGNVKKGEILGKIITNFSDLYFLTENDIGYYGTEVIAKENSYETTTFLKKIEDFLTSIEEFLNLNFKK